MNVHLICFQEPDTEAMQAVRDLWPGEHHFELNDTQIVVAKPVNGGKSIYRRIEEKLNRQFTALVVRFQAFHGRHNTELWEWLEAYVRS